jgi:carbonic anhydrase
MQISRQRGECTSNALTACGRSEATAELKERKLDFLPFPELKQAVKDDVTYLRETKLVSNDVVVSGWVYQVETGKTVRIV